VSWDLQMGFKMVCLGLILKHAPLEGKIEAKSKTLSQILEKY